MVAATWTPARRGLFLLALLPFADALAEDDAAWPADGGFRMDDYRAPTPSTVPGGRMINTAEARALLDRRDVVWIDLLPRPRRPQGLPDGTLWLPSPRYGVPGSLWLPEAGRGALSAATEAWFRTTVTHATGDDRDRPIVFYCLAECWMSWNAAKRVAGWGYRQVLWYRDGIDAWEAAGLPTEVLQPVPGGP